MPIVVVSSLGTASTTAQDIVSEVSQDVRKLLANSGADAAILLDYVNRTQLDILGRAEWPWMRSSLQTFVTRPYAPDYYFGNGATVSAHNTLLNLSDVRYIDPYSVRDRSNNVTLPLVKSAPAGPSFFDAALNRQIGRPLCALHDPDVDGYTVSLFPLPDGQNTVVAVPDAPVCRTTAGGALSARYYSVKATYIDSAGGESTPSRPARIFVPANQLLVANAPATPLTGSSVSLSGTGVTISQVKIYVNPTEGSETLQGTINLGATFTEPAGGLVAGAALPTASTLEPARGYLIEFRYFKAFQQVTALADVLQIPNDYKDVVKAGVNRLAFEYLKQREDSMFWHSLFDSGIKRMISDKNQFNPDFIRPSL